MKYQPHIDGLRSVAVLPVLIYHLGSPLIPGGYVGVDVFFVISGFLITGILLNEVETGNYSLLKFYKRRILRILPALAAVLIATFFLSHLLLFDAERQEVGRSIVATAIFVSNFHFWGDAGGYFTAPDDAKPLLNTWSLAVEEQFYIFFPPLLFALATWSRKYMAHIILVFSIISLVGCIILTASHPVFSFYLIPTRAWELGAGALLAILFQQGFRQKWHHPLIAPIGLALVIAPMLYLSEDSVFPGANAIAPVLGAALLIGWGATGVVGNLLSSRLLVFVGKISYSLYLWHWPVIVFWKAYSGAHLSQVEMFGLAIVSMALGTLSTYFIERPFRSSRALSIEPRKVIATCIPALVTLAALGWATTNNVFSFRVFPDEVVKTADVADYTNWEDYKTQFRFGRCMIGSSEGDFSKFDIPACTTVEPGETNVLVIGDSHAAQFWGALNEALPNVNVLQATASGCRPLIGAPGANRCTDMRDWVFQEFLPNNSIDLIVVGGRWRSDEIQFVPETLRELQKLAGDVIVFGPTVEYEGVFPKILAISMLNGHEFSFTENRTPGRGEANRLMKSMAAQFEVGYVDVLETICPAESCMLRAPDGIPMQFDYGHLTLSGARFVVQSNIKPIVEILD